MARLQGIEANPTEPYRNTVSEDLLKMTPQETIFEIFDSIVSLLFDSAIAVIG